MNKQKILFLTRTLTRAGVAVSLVSVLQEVDYSKYDVTVGVQFPYKDLESEIPSCVKIVYYGDMQSKLYKRIYLFNQKLAAKNRNSVETFVWHLLNRLELVRMKFKVGYCFGGHYDTAIAYHQGDASRYVMKCIKAKKKVMWYHAANIEFPWYKKLFSKADMIICDSENARLIMLDEWGDSFSEKIHTLNCIIPIDEIREKSREPIEIEKKPNQMTIFTCARLGEEKGVDLAVRAAAILAEIRPGFDFVWYFVGDGAERAKIEKLIQELGLHEKVKLLGFMSNPYPYFSLCDLYVQPSRRECFGITIVEAKALNKPVISTKTAGGCENISDCIDGLLVEIDAQSIAEAIMRIVDDPELCQTMNFNVQKNDYDAVREKARKLINESILEQDGQFLQ